ncbi:hypothetical protein P0D88_43670 [Paraburkholderia sp. RL18-103-BIB-C]|uniref:hypothetical protein n=1 Tax=unclassified Paraburkholderia TaxID=2615204 RepID=UPI0038BC7323
MGEFWASGFVGDLCHENIGHRQASLKPITRRCGAAMRDECFDIPDCLLALFEWKVMDRSWHRLEAEFAGDPSDGVDVR